jgi:hypothetical protein
VKQATGRMVIQSVLRRRDPDGLSRYVLVSLVCVVYCRLTDAHCSLGVRNP